MRRLLTLLLLIAAVNAFPQNTNPIGLSLYDDVFKYDAKNPDLTEDGFEVQYHLQGATYSKLKDYDFRFSIWCEKDPSNPVYPDGNVTDWNKLQQITFAVSPRFRNDFYVVTAPEKATKDLTITKELKRTATWRGVFYIYMYNSLFESLAPKDLNEMRFYLRYEIDFHSQDGNAHLTNGHRGERTACVIWKNNIQKLAVKSELTKVKGSETMDSEAGYNLNFEFPKHPVNMPFEVTISFWREKDPLHPLYSNDVIDDFKMMDMMQFTQSTKYPNIIGATWHNEEDYEIVSEYSVQKNEWKPFSIFLPEVLFRSFDPPYIPDDVKEVPVRYYITYHLSYSGGYVSNEQRKLPWVGWKYFNRHKQKVENIGSNDLGDLFGDDGGTKIPDPPGRKPPIPTPVPERKPTQVCDHVFRLIHNPEMYVHKLPTPQPPQQPQSPQQPQLPGKHIHYYYLWYTPICNITPVDKYVDVSTLPDEFYFEAAQHKSLFVRNIDDCHICKSPVVEGLWAAMFPEQEISRGYSSDDNTPLHHMNLEQANELMDRMNEYAKHKQLPWEFSVATAKEAKHAGLEFEETDEEDDEAFTADGCFYITAQSTKTPTLKLMTVKYKVFTGYSAYCRYPNCDYKESEKKRPTNRYNERAANRVCTYKEAWYNMRNKETEANLEKLKQQSSQDGGDDEIPEAQPSYIWYVKDVSYEKCAKCDEHRNGSDVVTLKSFTTKEKAEQYLNTLK